MSDNNHSEINKQEFLNCDPEIDYKNLELLKSSILDGGRIIPGRITGMLPWKQRKVSNAIKIARFLALLPYTDHH